MKSHDDQQFTERLNAQRERISKAEHDLKQAQDELIAKQADLKDTQAQLAEIDSQLADLTTLLTTRQQEVDSSQANWLAALKVAEQAKAKANSLKSLHDSYRGFYRGVANLLKHKNELTGIMGPVSDYLEIDDRYVKAIETALGGQAQHVISTDNRAASAAIKFLTKNRLGRVTLLPVSTIRSRHLNSGIVRLAEEVAGYIGVASDLVKMPENLTRIKEFLLGTTIIADNLDNAIQISRKISQKRAS